MARFTVSVSPADHLDRVLVSGGSQVAMSRDGTRLAYVAAGDEGRQLYIRALAADEARLVSGSTINASTPFFSPDGEWVGFFDDELLKKVSVGGGTPMTLAEAPANRGGTWNEDGVIVFASPSRAPLSHVSEDGGTPEPLTVLDAEWGETSHRQPAFLPGGHAVMFLAEGEGRKSRVVVHSFETGERHVLELTGPGVPILPDETTFLSVSDTGTLTYLATDVSSPTRRLVFCDSPGRGRGPGRPTSRLHASSLVPGWAPSGRGH